MCERAFSKAVGVPNQATTGLGHGASRSRGPSQGGAAALAHGADDWLGGRGPAARCSVQQRAAASRSWSPSRRSSSGGGGSDGTAGAAAAAADMVWALWVWWACNICFKHGRTRQLPAGRPGAGPGERRRRRGLSIGRIGRLSAGGRAANARWLLCQTDLCGRGCGGGGDGRGDDEGYFLLAARLKAGTMGRQGNRSSSRSRSRSSQQQRPSTASPAAAPAAPAASH